MASRIKWNGDQVERAVLAAAKLGIDQTMSACVIDAKQNHPGWRNRTGAAEGSMRIIREARKIDNENGAIGRWGSKGIFYMIWLELNHGSALRSSADRNYPSLKGRIKANLAGMVGRG